MVLMSVSENDSSHSVLVFNYISEIRNYYIHAGHIHIRECKTAVKNKHIIAAFKHCHILADLIESSKRNHSYRILPVFLSGQTAL